MKTLISHRIHRNHRLLISSSLRLGFNSQKRSSLAEGKKQSARAVLVLPPDESNIVATLTLTIFIRGIREISGRNKILAVSNDFVGYTSKLDSSRSLRPLREIIIRDACSSLSPWRGLG